MRTAELHNYRVSARERYHKIRYISVRDAVHSSETHLRYFVTQKKLLEIL